MELKNVQFTSALSTLKLVSEPITGTTTSPYEPAGSGGENVVTIAHGLGNDELIPVCTAIWSGSGKYVSTPYTTPDSRYAFFCRHDSTNIYIVARAASAGDAVPSTTFNYTLFIQVP